MNFNLVKKDQSGAVHLRRLGYALYTNREGTTSYVRRVHGAEFPRYHLYINKEDERMLICSLHIDQKAPSYGGSRMHGGDYDSDAVKIEVARLQSN